MAPKGRGSTAGPKAKSAQAPVSDSDAKVYCDEAAGHLKNGNYGKALNAYDMALELNPSDKNALVARSKCYILMGDPQLALKDAETALQEDKTFIRAIYQKAEALYYLGDFEHSLMYYHRGLRLRPELEQFRLGVQKAQEAIENTIGSGTAPRLLPEQLARIEELKMPSATEAKKAVVKRADSGKTIKTVSGRSRPASSSKGRQLLGELCVDKEYLEQLLKHPDINCPHKEATGKQIACYAQEGVSFLNNRQEFWRQQRPNAAVVKKNKKQPLNTSIMPPWLIL